jgi:ATP-dependent DNA helicase RecQ
MVLVVSPLISLMEDQVGRARKAGLKAGVLNSGIPGPERREVETEAQNGALRLLFVAPERLHLPGFVESLARMRVSLLAVDEAHCIAQWGHDFRPSYLRIGEIRPRIGAPVLALTATATPRVRQEIQDRLKLRNPVRVVGSFDRPNLVWEVRRAEDHGEKMAGLHQLLRRRKGATIVYSATRKAVEAVRRGLAARGLPAIPYHAGLPPSVRTAVQERFLRDPSPVVVATNAFGMGIDRADVRVVVHHQLPGSLEAYYQEAGRAGRDGEEARCIALFGKKDRRIHDRFVVMAFPKVNRLKRLHRNLLVRYKVGEEAAISWQELKNGLGGKMGAEEVRALVRALSRCRALVFEETEGEGSCDLMLTLRSKSLRLAGLEELRSIEEHQIEEVQAFARSRGCRRQAILAYFGEESKSGSCGRCDRCLEGPPAGLFGKGATD